ncbi:MAG: hypothetical protein ACFBSE_22245 [Prochloraceae cyanobacterium]
MSSKSLNSEFKSYQIVRLRHNNTCLYGEVIQVVPDRQLCWFRPLMLAIAPENELTFLPGEEPPRVVDLRMSSDLFWPVDLIEPAADTEVIPLLMQLEEIDFSRFDENKARASLHNFIKVFWQSRNSRE